jgi:hypothetical protein
MEVAQVGSWAFLFTRIAGQSEAKNSARPCLRLYPNPAPTPLDNALAKSQPNPGARILFASVKPLEHLEYSVVILGIDANAIVTNGNNPLPALVSRRNVHLRRLHSSKFDGIPNQILEQLHSQAVVQVYQRQVFRTDPGVRAFSRRSQIPQRISERLV